MSTDVVVCVTAGGGAEHVSTTVDSVKTHTPAEVPIFVQESPTDAAEADIVLLEPGCVVSDGWLDGLRDAAASTAAVATVSALTQHDLGLEPLPSFGEAAAVARDRALRLYARIPAARGPCVYVRRSAVELIGAPDAHSVSGAELSRRCTERGLAHVLADDVLVLDAGLAAAVPVESDTDGPVARSAARIRRAIGGTSVLIDGGILHGPTTGTHIHVLEVVAALARTGKVRLTVLVPDAPSEFARTRLESLPATSLITYAQASASPGVGADVVHRPFQVSNAGDIPFLRTLGDRLILTQQDLIGYHNPSYFPSLEDWQGYRRMTALALATVDRVAFFSAHARDDALREDLVDPGRASVVRLGVDHPIAATDQRSVAPAGADRLGDAPMILCLGTDLHHKNRVFALRVLERLKARHGWEGMLVLAGPTVRHGSSREQEALLLSAHPELASSVLDVGAVSEAEKAWLFARSALVVYPSVVEGFGLVPFEAAAHGVPCLWAPGSSLSEIVPDSAAEIVPWDAERTAEQALALMREADARERNLAAIRASASGLTWDATAAQLLDLYEATADAPPRTASTLGSTADPAAGLLGEDALRLVGPGGALPPDSHRPLLALATHPRIANPLLGTLKLGYRASYRLRRWRSGRSQSRR